MKLLDVVRSNGNRAEKIVSAYRDPVPTMAPYGRRGRAIHDLSPDLRERIREERIRQATGHDQTTHHHGGTV